MLNEKRIVTLNCGLGRDSITMICLLKERSLIVDIDGQRQVIGPEDVDAVVFSDTGCEWKHTYEAIPLVRQICESMSVPFVILEKPVEADWSAWLAKKAAGMVRRGDRPDWVNDAAACDGFSGECVDQKAGDGSYHRRAPVMDDYRSRNTVVSIGKGDCTCNHKIECIRRLIGDLAAKRFGVESNAAWSRAVRAGDRPAHLSLIGFAADERNRYEAIVQGPAYHVSAYPLVTMGITKAGEAEILERHGLGHVRKSGCFVCPYQPVAWYWALSQEDPGTFEKVKEYEAAALERNPRMNITNVHRPKRDGGGAVLIEELVSRWREQNPTATVKSVLDKSYGTERARKDAGR